MAMVFVVNAIMQSNIKFRSLSIKCKNIIIAIGVFMAMVIVVNDIMQYCSRSLKFGSLTIECKGIFIAIVMMVNDIMQSHL